MYILAEKLQPNFDICPPLWLEKERIKKKKETSMQSMITTVRLGSKSPALLTSVKKASPCPLSVRKITWTWECHLS